MEHLITFLTVANFQLEKADDVKGELSRLHKEVAALRKPGSRSPKEYALELKDRSQASYTVGDSTGSTGRGSGRDSRGRGRGRGSGRGRDFYALIQ